MEKIHKKKLFNPDWIIEEGKTHVLKIDLLFFKLVGKPFTGIVYDLHKNKNLKYEIKIVYGKKEGESKFYYKSGKLKTISNYSDNKLISKIPVLGDIIIPKQVGEGLFGISFKIKGKPGNIKTSINPIKTLTPRFIQRIIDRNKNSK